MKATYYGDVNSPCILNVAEGKAPKQGLVDLANEKGDIIITDCPVSESPKAGHVVLPKPEKAKKADKDDKDDKDEKDNKK